jgi:hypothetical protein
MLPIFANVKEAGTFTVTTDREVKKCGVGESVRTSKAIIGLVLCG